MRPSTFDVKERRKRIIVFKVGKLWIFKQFFEDTSQPLLDSPIRNVL